MGLGMDERGSHWMDRRGVGVLMHPTALPGVHGVGNIGCSALDFLEILDGCGLSYWQMFPLGPTGFGDSPYQTFSAFAGNPYLIDLNELVDIGLLERSDLEDLACLPVGRVDYGALYTLFMPLLLRAARAFFEFGARGLPDSPAFADFCDNEAHWLDDYAAFQALKAYHHGRCWLEWPRELRSPSGFASSTLGTKLAGAMRHQKFIQYVFWCQFERLRAAASSRGIHLIGDVPIFVALDSADVWANPELFHLRKDGRPSSVAGVPPDYFSEDGQLWGNPLYNWKVHQQSDYKWWLARLQHAMRQFDIMRLDHFRGFAAYWSIPAGSKTARPGRWVGGPGEKFFAVVMDRLPGIRIIAEDLGEITADVIELRRKFRLPGMAVLQFGFEGMADGTFLPHRHEALQVVYTGTHDNDTSLGWFQAQSSEVQDYLRRYLRVDGSGMPWDLIRTAYESVANLAIIPLQDFLSLGSEARMNRPGDPHGNWSWRVEQSQLDHFVATSGAYLKELAELYARTGRDPKAGDQS